MARRTEGKDTPDDWNDPAKVTRADKATEFERSALISQFGGWRRSPTSGSTSKGKSLMRLEPQGQRPAMARKRQADIGFSLDSKRRLFQEYPPELPSPGRLERYVDPPR